MLGEFCALGCALAWSGAVILFKRSDALSAEQMNLFKNTVALILLGLTMIALGIDVPLTRSGADWLRIAVSGLCGIAIADTLFLSALRNLGAGMTAIVECAYAPSVICLAMIFLGEQVGAAFAAGGGMVVAGVVLAALHGARREGRGSIAPAVLTGILSVFLMAIGIVIVKPVLEHSSLVEVTWARVVVGVSVQGVWAAARRPGVFAVFRPQRVWKSLLPAAILGSYVAMLLWLGGFKWASASSASVLNQTAAIFTLLLSRWVLGEPMPRIRLVGAVLALCGAFVVVLGAKPTTARVAVRDCRKINRSDLASIFGPSLTGPPSETPQHIQ